MAFPILLNVVALGEMKKFISILGAIVVFLFLAGYLASPTADQIAARDRWLTNTQNLIDDDRKFILSNSDISDTFYFRFVPPDLGQASESLLALADLLTSATRDLCPPPYRDSGFRNQPPRCRFRYCELAGREMHALMAMIPYSRLQFKKLVFDDGSCRNKKEEALILSHHCLMRFSGRLSDLRNVSSIYRDRQFFGPDTVTLRWLDETCFKLLDDERLNSYRAARL